MTTYATLPAVMLKRVMSQPRRTCFAAGWRAFARELSTAATEALALSKTGLNEAWERDLPEFLEIEAELQDRAGRTSDYAEGVRAFLEKRPASFQGR